MSDLRDYVGEQRGAALLRAIWIAINALGGGVLAAGVALGPLQWPTLGAALLGVTGGLLVGALWTRQQLAVIRGNHLVAGRLRLVLIGAPTAIVVAVVAFSAWQLYSLGHFAPITDDRVRNFTRLWRAMDRAYAYFAVKDADWNSVYARYLPRVQAAETEEAYLDAISEMLVELEDGHTYLAPLPRPSYRFAMVRDVEGEVVVIDVSSAAETADLRVGDILVAVDGQDVNSAIAALDPRLRHGSTTWERRAYALDNLLVARDDTGEIEVTIRRGQGASETLLLSVPRNPAVIYGFHDTDLSVSWERLDDGTGLITLPRVFANLGGHDIVAEFDTAVDALIDVPALVIDLRGNLGGSASLAQAMAGRLLERPFVYGHESWRVRMPTRAYWSSAPREVAPRGDTYQGHVAILIDALNVSSAEEFLAILVDSGRATTVGQRTGGSTGNPIDFRLGNHAIARFSTGELRRVDGSLIEGIGFMPDVPVVWTREDVLARRDPDLAAALELIR